MFTSLHRLAPVAVIAALGAGAFTLADDGGADAANGTTYYHSTAASQPTYFFFDAEDTAGAAIDPMVSNENARAYNSSGVCDNNPALEDRMAANGSDAALWYCGALLDSCPDTPAGQLLGVTVVPGQDPDEVLAKSTCWTYPAGASIERTAPFVYLPAVTAQDPVFVIAHGPGSTPEPVWSISVQVPGGPERGTEIRASEATVDGSVKVHSLGLTPNGGTETKGYDFSYVGSDGVQRWAMIGADDRWITTAVADGVTMDPQICLESGVCQETKTIQYVNGWGDFETATIQAHM